MSRTISVSYSLNAPEGVPIPQNLVTEKSYNIPIQAQGSRQKGFYEGLHMGLREVKKVLGDDLTAWRDVIGNAEAEKDQNKGKIARDEGKDDNEEEAEEEA